jgi:nitrite reductase (NADH) large subunit
VVHDCLGIAEQLEKEMEFMVETYQCEWRTVVENPELRKRFKHFVNTPKPDPTMEFKEERGQRFPQDWMVEVKK